MYELNYVRRRRRKILAAVIGALTSAGLSIFIITAFLGRYVGSFTVSLSNQDVALTMSEKSDFEHRTNYLQISEIAPFEEFTYGKLPEKSVLDNELIEPFSGGNKNRNTQEITTLNYFKYTFYVKNVGNVPCDYDFKINITENKPSTDGRYLDDTLRVMLFENDDNGEEITHESKVYAKRGAIAHLDEDGEPSFKEAITVAEDKATSLNPFLGYCEEFIDGSTVLKHTVSSFSLNDVKRYTIVTWLEGYDPQSNNLFEAPKGASIKLGVEINAYEN